MICHHVSNTNDRTATCGAQNPAWVTNGWSGTTCPDCLKLESPANKARRTVVDGLINRSMNYQTMLDTLTEAGAKEDDAEKLLKMLIGHQRVEGYELDEEDE